MAEPIETAVLGGQGIGSQCVDGFLNAWSTALRLNVHWRAEEATDVLCRTVGIGFAASVFEHADQITEAQGTALIEIVSSDKFRVQDRLTVLNLLAKRPNLHNLTGRFAQKAAQSIRRNESIDQRGNNYRELAENLLPMSVAEAREYYRQGLAELDQMGGDDHDIIYAILNFAAVQPGGLVRPELGHRLLNLCQTIMYDASKFGWTLLAKAAANSIGMPAAYKFVRWADQDVAPFLYGLPQFAGFSAAKGRLDPRRAAVIFILCEDIGWYDWKLGDSLADVLGRAAPEQRQGIFAAVQDKVRAEHPFGGWAPLWEGFAGLATRFPEVISGEEHKALEERAIEAQKRTDEMANRDDLHVIDKLHVERCLRHLNGDGTYDAALAKLHSEIAEPPQGYLDKVEYPKPVEPQSGFSFDYEFSKSEITTLARLFGLSQGEVIDEMAAEIKKRWPAATGMDYFLGHGRHRWHRSDRHEFFRQHVQKHALLSAATTFLRTLPVVRRSYEMDGLGPYHDWLGRYDVAFKDGSFLSDHKDAVPECAKAYLLARLKDRQPALESVDILLNRLGFTGQPDAGIPLYGRWKSVDGVWVRITAALSPLKGAVGRCQQFSKRPDHEFWIPIFDNDGYDDEYRHASPFEPLVWDFDPYPRGIDEGDKLATPSAAARPRLGIELTAALGLSPDADLRDWSTTDGDLAIRSQVWGEWQPNEYDHREDENNNGELLLANRNWLDKVLERQRKRLVLTVSFSKYKSRYDFEEVQQISSAYVLCMTKAASTGVGTPRGPRSNDATVKLCLGMQRVCSSPCPHTTRSGQ